MEYDKTRPWWDVEIYGDTEPAVVHTLWAAAQSPNVVYIPRPAVRS